MMSLLDIFFLAVALAMDCFTVSIVCGVQSRGGAFPLSLPLTVSFLFGLFQALMPLAGWMAISCFSRYIETVSHWIAFSLLCFIGGKMILDAFSDAESEHAFDPRKLTTQLLLAIATSIDALAVGITLGCTGYNFLSQLLLPLVMIGIVSLLFSLAGFWLGLRFGRIIEGHLRPELIGGIILILIGLKTIYF